MNETSEADFYLIDSDGHRRVPVKQRNETNRRYGFPILPPGKGNDPSSAEYTEDISRLVQRVVLDGQLVRAVVLGGKHDGQRNSVGLGRRSIEGYWLAPHLRHLLESTTTIGDDAVSDAEQDIAEATDLPKQETERQAVIAARRGQGVFRALLDEHWGSCAVTGCTNRKLLRASHIQRWRDSSNVDRLNPDNGLLLAAHVDAAFDAGLISFDDDGHIRIDDKRLIPADAKIIGIKPTMRLRHLKPEHLPFLARHRQRHGFL